jgi:hypothetical protein
VSGYLERLVGRHVEPPAVRPRAVSRFEGNLVGGTVVPEGASPDVRPATTTATSTQSDSPLGRSGDESIARPATPPIGRPNPPASVPVDVPLRAAAATTTDARRAAFASPPQRTDDPPTRSRDEAARAATPESPTVSPVAIRRADPPEVTANPAVAVTPARRSAPLAPPEPDVVHVHIGRVEVRAVVPPKETPRATPRPARAAPLSLDRYLAGERRS